MMSLLVVWLLSALGLFLTSKVVKGFEVTTFGSAMLASLVVGFLNMILRPLLLLLTLPVNILTLGLFTFVVNAMVLRLAAGLLKNFNIKGWGPAILGAFILALINMVIFWLLPTT
ncbi:MAG TPA: phage holin family protein [Bacteriovoracaceae bacterium]|nr:phage holin family protein [Bacteriovoracaceae bacterium]